MIYKKMKPKLSKRKVVMLSMILDPMGSQIKIKIYPHFKILES